MDRSRFGQFSGLKIFYLQTTLVIVGLSLWRSKLDLYDFGFNIYIQGDILIDDKPLIKGKDEPRWFHVLFTAAHNTHVTEYHSNQMRLDTWDKEALDKLIEEIKQKKAAK